MKLYYQYREGNSELKSQSTTNWEGIAEKVKIVKENYDSSCCKSRALWSSDNEGEEE